MMPVGSPAIGEDFVDREQEIKQILTALKKDNILLAAPRRFGKTSIMRKLERELFGDGSVVIFLDVESVNSPQRFLSEIIMELTDFKEFGIKSGFLPKIKNICKLVQDNIEEIEIHTIFKAKLRSSVEESLKEDWIDKSDAIFRIINNSNLNVYFIFDEFPIAIKNMDSMDAKIFLSWFRRLRQTCTNVRFIVGGSVSIERVLRNVGGTNVINDFKTIRVNGFERDVALQIVKNVFEEENWGYTPILGNKILDCVGESYIPYFVGIMLSAIMDEQIITLKVVDSDLIENVYNARLLGSKSKHYFDPYFDRLRIFYHEMDVKAAKAILGRISTTENYPLELAFDAFQQETGSHDYEHFLDLISDLENDFYIEINDGKLNFYSKMLKDWWRIFHGKI
ncbi:putative ATPase (AAA+ superfamily) [Methanosarcina siciliae C2J]|uniref:Putative ATPase (AAA+ superfamily) n=1 Tax=Methanosarcina siciliae C2J TaxID=1434118 RepID=A0A0E3PV19_9EURY|nr:ATP-binding protein [Methanosarcina siciliae]AKB38978.1 putative ATPase (AAA+ superfamily) [Methanosarcina siciliae C2J]